MLIKVQHASVPWDITMYPNPQTHSACSKL